MLTAAEVEAMPDTEVLRQLLLRADRIDSRLDRLDDALGGDNGIRSQLVALRSTSGRLEQWAADHEKKDDERHRELFGVVQGEKTKLDKLVAEVEDESEEERRESRKEARLDRRDFLVYVVAPVLGALGLGAVGYGTGTYFPPHEISDALADHSPIPAPRSPPAPSPSFPQGEVSE